MYSRDLFNDQLPLRNDLFFVGRDSLATEYINAIKQSQNRGLFGLRKTGKTSVLFKVRRLAERDGLIVLYFDCKDPAVRNLHWDQLIERIVSALSSTAEKKTKKVSIETATGHISDRFKRVVGKIGSGKAICIIFDEIEYVSPLSKTDTHWHREFIDFWQTMWTTQSEFRNISFLISGVNPSVIEMDQVDGIQNPVFSIVTAQYLTGLKREDIKILLNHIGQWMGMQFSEDAIGYLSDRYGGHPLLTRMACSHINSLVKEQGIRRPVRINRELLASTEQEREADISQYSRHVISELNGFYPDEYQLLEMLAGGNVAEFIDLCSGNDYIRHLRSYGLVDDTVKSQPVFKIPMIANYINQTRAQNLREAAGPIIIQSSHRKLWLQDRVSRIISDVRTMEKIAKDKGLPKLYGENGFPEAERFSSLVVADDLNKYENFINVCNRCFVEPVERCGISLNKRNYFWDEIKYSYPAYWEALLRTKIYRHEKLHLALNQTAERKLEEIVSRDFHGLSPNQVSAKYFELQQMVIDGIFVGLQVELERLS